MSDDALSPLCEFVLKGGKLECVRCDQRPLPGTLKLPVYRECRDASPRPPKRENPMDRCRFAGEPTGTVDCPSCGGSVKIKTFACDFPEVPHDRAAWTKKTLPADVAACRWCDFYERPLVAIEADPS